MPQRWTLSDLLRRGVIFDAHEAVAIVHALIDGMRDHAELTPPFGPPTVDTVEIGADGSVRCVHCGVTPAVSEIGALLHAMLPRAALAAVPGGLRYAVARAMNEVDAPPF